MSLQKLKQNLIALELEDYSDSSSFPENKIEVICDSLDQALRMASRELNIPIENLDYEIIQKGQSGFLGVGRIPYRIRIMYSGVRKESLDIMGAGLHSGEKIMQEVSLDRDGKVLVKVFTAGVMLTVIPPSGNGIPVDIHTVLEKIQKAGIHKFNKNLAEKTVKGQKGEQVKIADWIPNPSADSKMTVEISPDEMEVYINISSPKPGGRHLQLEEVIKALRNSKVVHGYQKEVIQEVLDMERYFQPIPGAKGTHPRDGKDGYVDYKVRIDKEVKFKEDEHGRVNFLAKGIVENVVQGQLLAELIPSEKGTPGKTVTGKVLPAKHGKEAAFKQGKGTILSSDKKRLIAEKNGQVIYGLDGKLTVEDIYTVNGDVGLDTGNIVFLGSVIVRGSVTDNMQVKASGNIEIGGSIQKSHVEAEGDIIVKGGIQGRDNARIESTAGSLFAKFIQNANVSVEEDIFVGEAIMHSKVHAIGKIICSGKRGHIVGGETIAGKEIRVKQLGAYASPPTLAIVGINPKILKKLMELKNLADESRVKMEKLEQNIRTLTLQKMKARSNFPSEKEEVLAKMIEAKKGLALRINEISEEKSKVQDYTNQMTYESAIHIEKTLFAGVTVEINGAKFISKDEYNKISLIEEKGNIKIIPYVEGKNKDRRKRSLADL